MTKRQVWRYKCDFCKKANCSRASIEKHEKGCTNNPNRICGMHEYCEDPQLPITELISTIVEIPDCGDTDLSKLRLAASHCPACILAALRQSGKSCSGFDFKKERDLFWADRQESPMKRAGY